MDWIHCNNCFQLPDSAKNFVLTSCGHIYCCDCEEKCARELCKLCGNQCLTINISSSMKPDVQIYFMDPGEILRKKLKEILQVFEFQKNHRARLMTYQKKQVHFILFYFVNKAVLINP
ncbi:RING finger protein 212, partial [Stegodyphus mimosarum]